jgi:uncharacterized protein
VDTNFFFIISYILILLGLLGSVIPVLPGPFLIWLGAFTWAWGDGFQQVGWFTLLALGVLTLLAWGSDLFLSTVTSHRAGASWKSVIGAILGGLVGAVLLSAVPILGTVLGAILGSVAGLWIVEYYDKRDRQAALVAVQAYIAGFLIGTMMKMTMAFIMVGIFIWQAFF